MDGMEPAEKDIEVMRSFIGRKRRERSEHLAKNLEKARGDFAMILDMTVREFDPLRVYQWGSLLEGRHFQEISDLDMAVEGITDPETFSRLCARAEEMTSLPLHIVQIEKVHPVYGEDIKKRGKIVHERQI